LRIFCGENRADHIDRPRLLRSTEAGEPDLYVEDTALQPKGDEQVTIAPQDAPKDGHESLAITESTARRAIVVDPDVFAAFSASQTAVAGGGLGTFDAVRLNQAGFWRKGTTGQ
jgi:hypothetical protein